MSVIFELLYNKYTVLVQVGTEVQLLYLFLSIDYAYGP